jgi:hypothetical protein
MELSEIFKSSQFLPTSMVFTISNWLNMYTVSLYFKNHSWECKWIMSFYLKYQSSSTHFCKFDLSVTSNPGGVAAIWLTSISE